MLDFSSSFFVVYSKKIAEITNECNLINYFSELVWHVLKVYQEASGALGNIDSSSIAKEACNVLCAGLNVFYPSVSERNQLLHRLLVEGNSSFVNKKNSMYKWDDVSNIIAVHMSYRR